MRRCSGGSCWSRIWRGRPEGQVRPDPTSIGHPVPDPNIGKRIAPSTGMVINDTEGFERTGYSVKVVDGTYRVGLGLDSNRGGEGLILTLDDDGVAGVIVGEGDDRLFLGIYRLRTGVPRSRITSSSPCSPSFSLA